MSDLSSECLCPLLSKFDESNMFEFIVNQGYGVKGLVDSGIINVPSRYIHPETEQIDRTKTIDASPYLVPPIDLSELQGDNKDMVIETICRAAKVLGFFQVINHGVQDDVMKNVKNAAHDFFSLPAAEKAQYLKGAEHSECKNVFCGTSFSPEVETSLEWKDYLSMQYINEEEARRFWPKQCRDAALDYLKSADKMISTIMATLIRGLGVEISDEELIASYLEAKSINMNYYPPCPNPELTVGVGRHSDLAALTVLLQDDIGGLFVKVEEKGWIEIPPVKGAIVINIGDTLEILSNGRYKSAEHRVIASHTKARVSVPIFISPRPHTMIGPLPGLPEKDGIVVYKQLLFGDYMTNYFGGAHQGKKTLNFARV